MDSTVTNIYLILNNKFRFKLAKNDCIYSISFRNKIYIHNIYLYQYTSLSTCTDVREKANNLNENSMSTIITNDSTPTTTKTSTLTFS